MTVIAPLVQAEILDWSASEKVNWVQRNYRSEDLAGAFMVISATDDPEVNQAVWQEAEQRGCLINVVDDPDHSNFIVPAVVRRGDLTLSVSTGGSSPALARRLRERLEAEFGPEYGALADILAELRPELLSRFEAGEPRLQAALDLVDSDLLQVIQEQGIDAGRSYARSRWQESQNGKE